MKTFLTSILVLGIISLQGQDYALYEAHYLRPLPGKTSAVSDLIGEHNKSFHSGGPYNNNVFSVSTGPRAGDFLFAMGPCTLTDLDSRPSGEEHDSHWAKIQELCERIDEVSFWTVNDELSYAVEDQSPRPLSMVRFFEVVDNELFYKVQGQLLAAFKEQGREAPRIMFQRRGLSADNIQWAIRISYKNYAEVDAASAGDLVPAFEKANGENSWATFLEDFNKAVVSRQDEWQTFLPEISGGN